MTIQEILCDIHALEMELSYFERKYGMRSEAFYCGYMQGEEPEDDSWVLDYTEWASIYKTWVERQAMHREETLFFDQAGNV